MASQLALIVQEMNANRRNADGTPAGNIGDAAAALETKSEEEDAMATIIRILNEHLSSLEWIDKTAAELGSRVNEIKRVGAATNQQVLSSGPQFARPNPVLMNSTLKSTDVPPPVNGAGSTSRPVATSSAFLTSTPNRPGSSFASRSFGASPLFSPAGSTTKATGTSSMSATPQSAFKTPLGSKFLGTQSASSFSAASPSPFRTTLNTPLNPRR